MFTEKVFDTGTIKINYGKGAPNGTPLVALHGDTSRWQGLNPLVPELEKDWHIFACDKRGHGKSSWGEFSRVVNIASDITNFIKINTGEPVVLIGHSGGKDAGHLIHVDQLERVVEMTRKRLKSNKS